MPIDPAVYEQLQQAIAQCGVPAAEAQITYEDYLQSEQIVVRSKELSDVQITCVLKVARGPLVPIIFFEDQAVAQRSHEIQREADREDARQWLDARGLLESLPAYNSANEQLADFGRKLERLCGSEPGTVLVAHESMGYTLDNNWLKASLGNPSKERDEQLKCLTYAVAASGLNVGFIGNEAYETKPK